MLYLRAMRARIVAACLVALLGIACARPPHIQRLTFVTTDPDAVKARVLREGVEGSSCFSRGVLRSTLTPPWLSPRADHGLAIADALEAVPGANVMTDVSMQVQVQQYLVFQRVCAIVRGDAGVLE
jgi:hypothetical protein